MKEKKKRVPKLISPRPFTYRLKLVIWKPTNPQHSIKPNLLLFPWLLPWMVLQSFLVIWMEVCQDFFWMMESMEPTKENLHYIHAFLLLFLGVNTLLPLEVMAKLLFITWKELWFRKLITQTMSWLWMTLAQNPISPCLMWVHQVNPWLWEVITGEFEYE